MHQNEPNQPNHVTQGVQGNQSPGTGTPLTGGTQSSVMHVAGAVLEQGLKTLKGFADFIPMAPGLGPALEVVCGCIEVYHVSILSMSV